MISSAQTGNVVGGLDNGRMLMTTRGRGGVCRYLHDGGCLCSATCRRLLAYGPGALCRSASSSSAWMVTEAVFVATELQAHHKTKQGGLAV
jgi:hypothetical protein